MRLAGIWVVFVVAFAAQGAQGYSAEPCELESVEGGLICVVEGGDEEDQEREETQRVVVEVLHPALFADPESFRQGRGGARPVGPVRVGEDYYYALEQELLRFDPQARRVVERVRFVASITDLSVKDGELQVHLQGDRDSPQPIVVGRDGPRGGSWNWARTLTMLKDVMWLAGVPLLMEPGATSGEINVEAAADEELVQTLRARRNVDPTNPYVELYLGEAFLRLERSEEAESAFRRAVAHEFADWMDLLRMGIRLEYRDRPQLAAQAFERGREEMHRAGVRGEEVTGWVNATFGALWFQEAMKKAIATRDAAQAERLVEVLRSFFPELEGSAVAWGRLANFLEQEGQEAQAEIWRERAERLKASATTDAVFEQGARAADFYLSMQVVFFVVVLMSGALLGLRRRPSEKEKRGFAPGDLVVFAAVLLLWGMLPKVVAEPIYSMATLANAPAQVTGDAGESPQAKRWLAGLSDFDETTGLVQAVWADTKAKGVVRPGDALVSQGAAADFPWLQAISQLDPETKFRILLLGFVATIALFFGWVVQIAAAQMPAVAARARQWIVGAPRSLGFLRILVLLAFITGLVWVSPLSRAAQASTEQTLAGYFGLLQAPPALSTPMTWWGLGLIVAALILHGVGVYVDARESAKE